MRRKLLLYNTLKNSYRLIIVAVFLFTLIPNSQYHIEASKAKNKFVAISATITVDNNEVCQNGTKPIITFKGEGGTTPYIFTYTLNNVEKTISTNGTNDFVTIDVNTNTADIFTYELIRVEDKDGIIEAITGQNVVVTVHELPTVNFTFTNDNSCAGTLIKFTPDVIGNSPFTYTWNFGDGATSSASNPTHIFTPALGCGTTPFDVTLTVTDNFNCSYTIIKSITIKEKPYLAFIDLNPGPAGQFNNCGNNTSGAEYSVQVGNNSSSTCIDSFDINWGDGTSQNNVSFPLLHSYLDYGTFNMVITGIGDNGCNNSVTYVVKNATNPSGGISTPGDTQNLCAPTAGIIFEITGWGTNTSDTTYEIDFGDNSSSVIYTQDDLVSSVYYNSTNPTSSLNFPIAPHSYTKTSCPDEFTVQLWIRNACKANPTPATLSNILIIKSPEASFEAPDIACLNTGVDFICKSSAKSGLILTIS